MVGLTGLEPVTSRLSVERSSQLSYRPMQFFYILFSYVNFHLTLYNLYKLDKLLSLRLAIPYYIALFMS